MRGITNLNLNNGGGGGSGVSTQMLYTGKESAYQSDSSFTPQEFDVRTEGTDFGTYLSTSDHKTFTVLRNMACLVTFGCEQDPNLSSSNAPNTVFVVNGSVLFKVQTPSSASGSNAILAGQTVLFAGDTFYWGSDNTSGYAVRLGQIDLLDGYDLTNYVKPSF